MLQKLHISAILITKNEEKNIEACLKSLDWVAEVVMVDSGSTDKTLEIAQQFPQVKVLKSKWLGYSPTKRLAVQNTQHDWIFWIDADERVIEKLKREIIALFSQGTPEQVAYDMPRKTFFMGEWVAHTGWYPGRVIRLFNKHFCDFNDHILHEGIEIPADKELGHLQADLLHYSYTSLYQYFHKMNYYGKYGAEELLRKGKKLQAWKIILSPLAMFLKSYFFQKGFLDGSICTLLIIG